MTTLWCTYVYVFFRERKERIKRPHTHVELISFGLISGMNSVFAWVHKVEPTSSRNWYGTLVARCSLKGENRHDRPCLTFSLKRRCTMCFFVNCGKGLILNTVRGRTTIITRHFFFSLQVSRSSEHAKMRSNHHQQVSLN